MTTDFCLAATKSLRPGDAHADSSRVALVIRRITIAVLAAFLAGAVLAVPASSKGGPAVVAKKKAKKCKKGKKGKKAKKRKGCKRGSDSVGLPGEATPASPKQPNTPPPPPDNPVLQVESVALTTGTVLGGNSTTGQVTVDDFAPSGGQVVNLQSDSPRASLPGSVLVAAGQKSATFQVTTTSGPPTTATLTASIGTSTANTELSIVDHASVSSVKLERRCFTFGPFSSNRVSLDVPAPADTLVGLSSNSAALTVPSGVTVPSGSTSAFFPVNAVSDSSSVSVTATLGSSQASDTVSVSETDPPTHTNGLTLNPDTVTPDSASTATVTLDCEAPAGGTVVNLSSVDPSHVHAPATVTVPADERSVTFQVTTEPDTADDNYDISANVQGDPPADAVQATLHVVSVLPT
jgi:hypothetical protein